MPLQQWSDRVWVADVARDPVFTEELETLLAAVKDRKPLPSVVVDLAGTDYVNSSNLSQLLKLRKVLSEGDTRLRIAGVSEGVRAVFHATGLDKVFTFSPDRLSALAELQMAGV